MSVQAGDKHSVFCEYDFGVDVFARLQRLIYKHSGISISQDKRSSVYARLSRRLRALGLDSFCDYCRLIEEGNVEELEHFTNALTTNLTGFFRERHHFEYLRQEALPELLLRNNRKRKLRIWSAGCSTGEEPYSIATLLLELMPHINSWDIKLLATDIDTDVLETAREGIYPAEEIAELSNRYIKAGFQRGTGSRQGLVRVTPAVRKLVDFRQHNLMDDWPTEAQFDIVFCRNVVIYFDKPTRERLFDHFAEITAPGGYLFIGHSESLYRISERFELIGRTVYRRIR